MSRNRRHTPAASDDRAKIIARRHQMVEQIIGSALRGNLDKELSKLEQQYGEDEVRRITEILDRRSKEGSHILDGAKSYRYYRIGFARFGGARRLLSEEEVSALNSERATLLFQKKFKIGGKKESEARLAELNDLLQMDWEYWEDITPENIPPRPADYPAPAEYPAPLAEILNWGWDLDPERIAREAPRWRAYESGLEKIVFDETLRAGWPSEPASWAPWHALRLLGEIGAYSSARRLADLRALPNDWLSDLLPDVWANMGAPAEISLWDILDDPQSPPEARGLAAVGLQYLVENEAVPRMPIVSKLAERLAPPKADHPDVVAYVVCALDNLEAEEVEKEIRAAYEQNLVNTSIISLKSLFFENDGE